MASELTRQTTALLQLTTAIRNLTTEMRPLIQAQEEVSEVVDNMAEQTENAANIFTRFGEALGNPQSKLQPFLKFGYAFIPMFFRVKNAIELTSLAVGKFIEKIKDPNAGGLLLSAGRNIAKNFARAKEILSGVDAEGNQISRLRAFGNFMGGDLIKSAIKFFRRSERDGQQRKRLGFTTILKNIGAVAMVLLKYLFIGSLLIPLLISFFRSERFQKGIFNVVKALKTAFGILQTAFGFIKDGVELIFQAITGGGSFFENFKLVFSGLLSIAGGILTGLFGVLVATIGSGIAFIVGVLGFKLDETLKEIRTKANNFVKNNYETFAILSLLLGVGLAIVGFTLQMLVAFGILTSAVAALPLLIGGVVLVGIGALLAKLNPFANGGVVGSGLQLVGERGPEIVKLPTGSRVHSNRDSRKMMSGSTNNITVNVQGRIGASDTELRQIASKIGSMINKEVNRTTSSRGTLG